MDMPKSCSRQFRHNAGFGKRMEFWVIGEMLKQGLDVYIPLVDDRGVDAIIRRPNATFAEVQIKARSKEVVPGNAALFAGIAHEEQDNYWFIFHAARIGEYGTTWILSSREFLAESMQNKTGKNAGKRTIWLNGTRTDKKSDKKVEYCRERYRKYICSDFSRIMNPELYT